MKKIKQQVQERIKSGEICIGDEIVPITHSRYIVQEGEIREETIEVTARKIPLYDIRRRLLERHEELGLIRQHPDEYYAALSSGEIKEMLIKLHEHVEPNMSDEELREKLKSVSRTRLLKVWHDHSEIAGHSHLLVLVAAVYDLLEEIQSKGVNIDVPTVVEDPQIHILGRSTSSLSDQAQFIESRRECLLDLSQELTTKAGIPVNDVMRFFHGDGPAMQFEAGNKIGGYYSCVGCEAHSSRFEDLAYCFHAHRLTLSEHQQFILKGEAWKCSHHNPLRNLKVGELRKELEQCGLNTKGLKKQQLQKEDGQKGIANVPAILKTTPQVLLKNIHLGK